jgi:hypothetical protein
MKNKPIKKEALELVESFWNPMINDHCDCWSIQKDCAIVVVDKVIEILKSSDWEFVRLKAERYEQVREEIELL